MSRIIDSIKILNSISKKFNIPYLDYSHDVRITYNPMYFLNSDHLNDSGKERFGRIVFNDISKYYKHKAINNIPQK